MVRVVGRGLAHCDRDVPPSQITDVQHACLAGPFLTLLITRRVAKRLLGQCHDTVTEWIMMSVA